MLAVACQNGDRVSRGDGGLRALVLHQSVRQRVSVTTGSILSSLSTWSFFLNMSETRASGCCWEENQGQVEVEHCTSSGLIQQLLTASYTRACWRKLISITQHSYRPVRRFKCNDPALLDNEDTRVRTILLEYGQHQGVLPTASVRLGFAVKLNHVLKTKPVLSFCCREVNMGSKVQMLKKTNKRWTHESIDVCRKWWRH